MIAFPRRVARRFRAACAKCIAGRPRGPAPPVVIRQSKGRVTLTATFPDVTFELACGTPEIGTEVLVAPMVVLDAIGGAGPDLVQLEGAGVLRGTARWTEKGEPRAHPVELLLPGKQHDPLPHPPELKSVPARLLNALHEAGRTASREDGRFALSRVQVRGAKGHVIATDGKIAVVFGGLPFPFVEDALVPALPLFGSPEVRDDAEVYVGRTASHLVVSAGDWTVWLNATAGKFPDVAEVIPRHAPTTVALDRGDASELLLQLPQLPGQNHELRPVTLDAVAGGVLAVRGGDDTTGAVKEVTLARSSVTGAAATVVLDRRALARVLALGCTELRLTPDEALVGVGDDVTVLAALLDPDLAVRAPNNTLAPTTPPEPERNIAMKPHETNGHAPGRHDPPASDAHDPLAIAEELRAALADATTKAARLVTALRQSKKEKKALSAVLHFTRTEVRRVVFDEPEA